MITGSSNINSWVVYYH